MTKFFILFLGVLLHPSASLKMLEHCKQSGHTYNLHCHNFNFDMWCDDCGEVFLDEVK